MNRGIARWPWPTRSVHPLQIQSVLALGWARESQHQTTWVRTGELVGELEYGVPGMLQSPMEAETPVRRIEDCDGTRRGQPAVGDRHEHKGDREASPRFADDPLEQAACLGFAHRLSRHRLSMRLPHYEEVWRGHEDPCQWPFGMKALQVPSPPPERTLVGRRGGLSALSQGNVNRDLTGPQDTVARSGDQACVRADNKEQPTANSRDSASPCSRTLKAQLRKGSGRVVSASATTRCGKERPTVEPSKSGGESYPVSTRNSLAVECVHVAGSSDSDNQRSPLVLPRFATSSVNSRSSREEAMLEGDAS